MSRYIISSTTSLHFMDEDEDLYQMYKEECILLDIKYYAALRRRHGIWAANQDRYVKSFKQLNDFDSKTMERLYSIYTALQE